MTPDRGTFFALGFVAARSRAHVAIALPHLEIGPVLFFQSAVVASALSYTPHFGRIASSFSRLSPPGYPFQPVSSRRQTVLCGLMRKVHVADRHMLPNQPLQLVKSVARVPINQLNQPTNQPTARLTIAR